MTDLQKATANVGLGITSLIVVSVFWKQPYLLTAILILISGLIIAIRTERQSIVVYVTGFIFSPAAEVVAIHAGAWKYAVLPFLGFPSGCPFSGQMQLYS